ncbi:MAG: alpha/beta hydrolase [Magnetovibrionaceae bacterium]
MDASAYPERLSSAFPTGLEVLHEPSRWSDGRYRPPLVFLHGAFSGGWIWAENFMPWFAEAGYDCFAPSFRGHGKSSGIERLHEFGIDDYVEDALRVISALGDAPVLVGHSMGGYVVQKLLARIDVEAYCLMASVPPTGLMGPAITMAWFQPWLLWRIGEIQHQGVDIARPETFREALFREDIPEELAATYMSRAQNESRRATLDMYGPAVSDPWRLRVFPALVMGAQMDRLIAPMHVRQTAAIVGTTARLLPDLGHGMMLERDWESAAKVLLEFLEAL